MRTIRSLCMLAAATMFAAVTLVPSSTSGCGTPPPLPPGTWFDGSTLYVELSQIFPTSSPHACSCGIGLGSVSTPLGPFFLLNPRIGKLRKTPIGVEFEPLVQFDSLFPSNAATDGWQNGTALPGLGNPIAGSTWFGFGGIIPPVAPDKLELDIDQVWVLCIEVFGGPGKGQPVPAQELAGLPIQIGAGLGNADFSPLFDPADDHSAKYSPAGVVGGSGVPIPTAGEWALIVLSLLLLTAGTVAIRRQSVLTPAAA